MENKDLGMMLALGLGGIGSTLQGRDPQQNPMFPMMLKQQQQQKEQEKYQAMLAELYPSGTPGPQIASSAAGGASAPIGQPLPPGLLPILKNATPEEGRRLLQDYRLKQLDPEKDDGKFWVFDNSMKTDVRIDDETMAKAPPGRFVRKAPDPGGEAPGLMAGKDAAGRAFNTMNRIVLKQERGESLTAEDRRAYGTAREIYTQAQQLQTPHGTTVFQPKAGAAFPASLSEHAAGGVAQAPLPAQAALPSGGGELSLEPSTPNVMPGTEKGKSGEIAGKTAMSLQGYEDAAAVSQWVSSLDLGTAEGRLDIANMWAGANGIPNTDGATYRNRFNMASAAKLRGETGAVINESELADLEDRYLPKPWDRTDLVKQKMARMEDFFSKSLAIVDPALYKKLKARAKPQDKPEIEQVPLNDVQVLDDSAGGADAAAAVYNSLPSGATYRMADDPPGTVRTKP